MVEDRVDALCRQGLLLQAYDAAKLVPSSDWSTRLRVSISGIAYHLGAPTFSRVLDTETYRRDPHDADAVTEYAGWLISARGPYETARWLRARPPREGTSAVVRARYRSMLARCAAMLRDFDLARSVLADGDRDERAEPAIATARAVLLELEDRREDALAAARDLLDVPGARRVALSTAARLLVALDRDREALELLREREPKLECPDVTMQLATLEAELRLYEDESRTLDRYASQVVLAEPMVLDFVRARRSDNAYFRGDYARALELARGCEQPFFKALAKNLESKTLGDKRVRLDVNLVRQHHMTCAPATLTSIARFFGRAADHLQVAEEICYDGTPAHNEREWARKNGWVAREFTMSWDSARALLDLGLPFTLTLTGAVSAHLVAVIGYDERRGSLFFRDPGLPLVTESLAENLLKHYAPYGPRAMVMVPEDRAGTLPELPDQALFDRLDRVNGALVAHDRTLAERELALLREVAPNHRITLYARRALAAYDDNEPELLAVGKDLLALDARDASAESLVLQCLRNLTTRAEHLAQLEAAVARENADPVFGEQLGALLTDDARTLVRGRKLLRESVRARPDRALPLHILGRLAGAGGAFDDAIEMTRFASCLEESNEGFARGYFQAARAAGRTDEALAFLEQRHERLSPRAAGPTQTLFLAFDDLERTERGFEFLDRALQRRPDDGELLLFAAEANARYGRTEVADARLRSAKGRARAAAIASSTAVVHRMRGEWEEELRALRELLAIEPASMEAHSALAYRLGKTEGRSAAIAHLDAARARFPHHRGLARLTISYLREYDAVRADRELRAMLELDPSDAWAHRELALLCAETGRLDAAFASCTAAALLRPDDAAHHNVLAVVCARAGRVEEARDAFHRTIALEPDRDRAISELFNTPLPLSARIEDVERVANVVLDRTVDGSGALTWYVNARAFLDGSELLAVVEQFATTRSELWAAWSMHVQHLLYLQRGAEARDVARRAVELFPTVPRLWFDLAHASETAHDEAGAIDALEHALQINPAYVDAAVARARLLHAAGDPDRAHAALERLLIVASDAAAAHLHLAASFFRRGERPRAIELLKRAIAASPDEERLWVRLHNYHAAAGESEGALPDLRAHVEARPWDTDAMVLLARILRDTARYDEALTVAERALAIDPYLVQAHDLRASTFMLQERFDEALAACSPAWRGGPSPFELEGRAAAIEWARENFERAIIRLNAVVAQHPDYTWGFLQLVQWNGQRGAHDEELRAANRLVEIAPTDAHMHALVGDARVSLGDNAGAKEAFVRALRLDPQEGLALERLFDLQLRDRELDAAETTIEKQRSFAPDEAALKELRLALRREDNAAALGVLRRLGTSPDTDEDTLSRARNHLLLAGLGDETQNQLDELTRLGSEHVSRAVGTLYMRTVIARDNRPSYASLPLAAPAPAARAAVTVAFEALVKNHDGWWSRWLALRGLRSLRVFTQDWAAVGHALMTTGGPLLGALWLGGRASREGLQPWMVSNQGWALRRMGLWRRSFRAHREALSLPADGTTEDDKVYVAFDDAAQGRTEAATALLETVNEGALDDFARSVLGMTRAMLAVQTHPRTTASERRAAFRTGRRALEEVCSFEALHAFSCFSRMWHRAARRIALDCPSLESVIWSNRVALIVFGVAGTMLVGLALNNSAVLGIWIALGMVALLFTTAATRWAWSQL